MTDRFTDDPYADREALASLLEQAERQKNAALVLGNEALAEWQARAEQAEREREIAEGSNVSWMRKAREAEARLAKADALAEALREIAAYEEDCIHQRQARDALAAYEQEQKP